MVPSPSTVTVGSLPFYCYCWFSPLLLLLLVLSPSTVTASSLPFCCYRWFSLVLSRSQSLCSFSPARTLSLALSPAFSLPRSLSHSLSSSTSLPLSICLPPSSAPPSTISLLRSHFRCPSPALSFPLSAPLSLSRLLVFTFYVFLSFFLLFFSWYFFPLRPYLCSICHKPI